MKSSSSSKNNSQGKGAFELVTTVITSLYDYIVAEIFIKEELYTQLFSILFIILLYVNSNADDSVGHPPSSLFELDDSMKVVMWLSLLMAVIAHLVPKKGKKNEKKEQTPEQKQKNLFRINERLKESLMTAITLEEQRRLEQVRGKT